MANASETSAKFTELYDDFLDFYNTIEGKVKNINKELEGVNKLVEKVEKILPLIAHWKANESQWKFPTGISIIENQEPVLPNSYNITEPSPFFLPPSSPLSNLQPVLSERQFLRTANDLDSLNFFHLLEPPQGKEAFFDNLEDTTDSQDPEQKPIQGTSEKSQETPSQPSGNLSEREFLQAVANNLESLPALILVEKKPISDKDSLLFAKDKGRGLVFFNQTDYSSKNIKPVYIKLKEKQENLFTIINNQKLQELRLILSKLKVDWEKDPRDTITAQFVSFSILNAGQQNNRNKKRKATTGDNRAKKQQKTKFGETLSFNSDFFHMASPKDKECFDWLTSLLRETEVVVPLIWSNEFGFQYDKGPFDPRMHQRVSVTSKRYAAVGAMGPEERFSGCEEWRRAGRFPVVTIGVSSVVVLVQAKQEEEEKTKQMKGKMQRKIENDGSMVIVSCEVAGKGVCMKWEDVIENGWEQFVIGSPLNCMEAEEDKETLEVACWVAPTTKWKTNIGGLEGVEGIEKIRIAPGERVAEERVREEVAKSIKEQIEEEKEKINEKEESESRREEEKEKVEEDKEVCENQEYLFTAEQLEEAKVLEVKQESEEKEEECNEIILELENIIFSPYPNEYSPQFHSTEPEHIPPLQQPLAFDLNWRQLQTFPKEIFAKATYVKALRLDDNQITIIPRSIYQLISLQILSLNNNSISQLPAEIYQLSNLRSLNLANNRLTAISEEVKYLMQLESLDLSNNQIRSLPFTTVKSLLCLPLKKFNISENPTICNLKETNFVNLKKEILKIVQIPDCNECEACKKGFGFFATNKDFCRDCGTALHSACGNKEYHRLLCGPCYKAERK